MVRIAAARAAVLLKNDGTLPLDSPARVLLTGPYATRPIISAHGRSRSPPPRRSLADELRASGCRMPMCASSRASRSSASRSDDVDAAATAALECDVVVVCVGEPSSLSGEAASRSDLRLPGRQAELIRAIAGTGIPFVVVLANGRPLVVADWIDDAPAVLEVWHGGTEAPAAIVDLLLGEQRTRRATADVVPALRRDRCRSTTRTRTPDGPRPCAGRSNSRRSDVGLAGT